MQPERDPDDPSVEIEGKKVIFLVPVGAKRILTCIKRMGTLDPQVSMPIKSCKTIPIATNNKPLSNLECLN